MITAGPPVGSADSANAAEKVVPSADVSSIISADAPPAMRGRTRSAGRSGGWASKAKHTAALLGSVGQSALDARRPAEAVARASRVGPMSILGNRVTRSEDPRFITGSATFGEDVDLPGTMYATFVRSISAHARIRSIDTSAVSEIPGARAFTAASGPGGEGAAAGTTIDLPVMPQAMPGLNEQMIRPVIATDGVRYAGEIVAVVVTEDRLQGADAAERVIVD